MKIEETMLKPFQHACFVMILPCKQVMQSIGVMQHCLVTVHALQVSDAGQHDNDLLCCKQCGVEMQLGLHSLQPCD